MDISVIITNAALAKPGNSEPRFLTERRITPTWTVMQVKAKLETMTGIPPGCQRLRVKVPGRPDQWADGDDRLIGDWGLVKGSEIEVGSPFFFLCFAIYLTLIWLLCRTQNSMSSNWSCRGKIFMLRILNIC